MTLERWKTFKKREQLLFIGSEFERARVWQEEGDAEKFRGALERAVTLINLSLQDKRWVSDIEQLRVLRREAQKFQTGENQKAVSILYQVL